MAELGQSEPLDLGVTDKKAKDHWPDLKVGTFERTSFADPDYNCVAWAMHDTRHWWEPLEGKYWPKRAPFDYRLESYISAFRTKHYVLCEDGDLDPLYEKIAIYATEDGCFQHVARQLPDGRWSSKLGEYRDIAHPLLESLDGDYYGSTVRFMRRPRAQAQVGRQRPKVNLPA